LHAVGYLDPIRAAEEGTSPSLQGDRRESVQDDNPPIHQGKLATSQGGKKPTEQDESSAYNNDTFDDDDNDDDDDDDDNNNDDDDDGNDDNELVSQIFFYKSVCPW